MQSCQGEHIGSTGEIEVAEVEPDDAHAIRDMPASLGVRSVRRTTVALLGKLCRAIFVESKELEACIAEINGRFDCFMFLVRECQILLLCGSRLI
jgi:hypothetical protein